MIKLSIIYATRTNHSKKIAEAIGSALNINVENIRSQPNFKDIDLLFIVGGIYGGESMPELLDYVRGLNSSIVKSVALVTNCASGRQRQVSVHKILDEKGINVVDEFVCRGAILFVSLGRPNTKDLKEAVDFAVREKRECENRNEDVF